MADTIMVAYSFNEDNPLKTVQLELNAITMLVQKTKCKIDPLVKATQVQLENRIALLKDDILIFHYAGHAGDASVELNDEFTGEMYFTDMKVFAEIIAADATALRLVFLNGCSTADQVNFLLDQKIPAVISTNLPLDDNYAFEFAKLFYEKFFNKETNLSLQKAFDNTIRSFNAKENTKFFTDAGELNNPELIHPAKRGSFKIGPNTNKSIYRLDGETAVREQTFADWQITAVTQLQPVTDLDKTKPINLGLSEDCYLLCDRQGQADTVRDIIKKKMQGALPDPNFIFINCHNNDGPPDLLQRFEKYVLPELCTGGARLDYLKFPPPDFFDIGNDPQKPLEHLKNIYNEQVSNKSQQKFGNDTLLILCHKIYKPFWKEGLKPFFEYYLDDYSKILRQELSERLVIFFLLIHAGKPEQLETLPKYAGLYETLKANRENRVDYFKELPRIEDVDILEWHDNVFKSALDTGKYPIEPPEMYFVEAREIMKGIITARNTHA